MKGWLNYWIEHLEKCYDNHSVDLDHKDCLEIANMLRDFKDKGGYDEYGF